MRSWEKNSYIVGLRNAVARGVRDARAGKPITANPYKRMEHQECWRDGWNRAQKEDRT